MVCTCVHTTSFQDSAFFINRERRCGGHVTIVKALLVLNSRNLGLNKLEQRELFSHLNPKKSEQALCRGSRAELVISDPDAGATVLHLLSLLLPALCIHSPSWSPAFFLWQQHERCQWPAPHLILNTQIPSLARNAQNVREDTMFNQMLIPG